MTPSQSHGRPAVRPLREGDRQRSSWGAEFGFSEGTLWAELPVLRTVGVRDLCDVEQHDRVSVAGIVSHTIRFRGGGMAHFAYNLRGELIELSGHGISAVFDPEGRVLLGAFVPLPSC